MTLLDAYALIAFLAGGPAAPDVRVLLRAGDAAVATANLVEVLDVSERVRGVNITRARRLIDPLFEGSLTPLPLDLPTAFRAGEIRSNHYRARTCAISLADAVLIASSGPGDRIATADPAVLSVAAAEGLGVLQLPGEG